jgi:capsular exopolysaccharide synthesis family protein
MTSLSHMFATPPPAARTLPVGSAPQPPVDMAPPGSLVEQITSALQFGVGLLRERLDAAVGKAGVIQNPGVSHLLGTIPFEEEDPNIDPERLAQVIYEVPDSRIAESLRRLRTRMKQGAVLDMTRSILVTSAAIGEGKTTIASNLAASLALDGRRILLIDANFGRPWLHRAFRLPNHPGLIDLLKDPELFDEAVNRTDLMNLSVLPSGEHFDRREKGGATDAVFEIMNRASLDFDHLIFDGGPLISMPETIALAHMVDGVITVVKAHSNKHGVIKRLVGTLRQRQITHLGTVLNGVRPESGGARRQFEIPVRLDTGRAA